MDSMWHNRSHKQYFDPELWRSFMRTSPSSPSSSSREEVHVPDKLRPHVPYQPRTAQSMSSFPIQPNSSCSYDSIGNFRSSLKRKPTKQQLQKNPNPTTKCTHCENCSKVLSLSFGSVSQPFDVGIQWTAAPHRRVSTKKTNLFGPSKRKDEISWL